MQKVFSWPVITIIFLFLAALSFFLSASETSIIALSRIRLRHMLARGVRRAGHIQHIINKLDKFIVAILVGNNFVNIAMSAITTGICVLAFGYKWGVIIATGIASFFIVIVCEITPKILAIKNTERIALFISPLMEVFLRVFNPVIAVFTAASNAIIRLLKIKSSKKSPLVTEEELRLMIELGKEEGFLSAEEGKMLQRIFEFGDITVGDVMIPREEMIAVSSAATGEQLLDIFVEKGHARLPVYEGATDKVIGIVYARDLLYILRDKGLFILQDLVHPAYYIPRDLPVSELLKKFQAEKIQIAVVADKQNRALGLVTLEDLLEEIVGEIEEVNVNHFRNKN
jgi:putative hemolysin